MDVGPGRAHMIGLSLLTSVGPSPANGSYHRNFRWPITIRQKLSSFPSAVSDRQKLLNFHRRFLEPTEIIVADEKFYFSCSASRVVVYTDTSVGEDIDFPQRHSFRAVAPVWLPMERHHGEVPPSEPSRCQRHWRCMFWPACSQPVRPWTTHSLCSRLCQHCMQATERCTAGPQANSVHVATVSFIFSEYIQIHANFKNLYIFDLNSEKYETNFLEYIMICYRD
jgi:hypothetical protein